MQKSSLLVIVLTWMALGAFMISCDNLNRPPHGAQYGCVCSYTDMGFTAKRDYTAFELNEMGLLNCMGLQQALRQQGQSNISCNEK